MRRVVCLFPGTTPIVKSFTLQTPSPKNVSHVYQLVFDQEVAGLAAGSFTVSANCVISSVSLQGATGFTSDVELTCATTGLVTLTLLANGCQGVIGGYLGPAAASQAPNFMFGTS